MNVLWITGEVQPGRMNGVLAARLAEGVLVTGSLAFCGYSVHSNVRSH